MLFQAPHLRFQTADLLLRLRGHSRLRSGVDLFWRHHVRRVSWLMPNRPLTTWHVFVTDPYSPTCSRTIRTARACSSALYFLGMTPILPEPETMRHQTRGDSRRNGLIELHRRIAAASAAATTTASACSSLAADSTYDPTLKYEEPLKHLAGPRVSPRCPSSAAQNVHQPVPCQCASGTFRDGTQDSLEPFASSVQRSLVLG